METPSAAAEGRVWIERNRDTQILECENGIMPYCTLIPLSSSVRSSTDPEITFQRQSTFARYPRKTGVAADIASWQEGRSKISDNDNKKLTNR